MTRIIAFFLIVLAVYGVWEGWVMWDNYNHNQDLIKRQQTAEENPAGLAGMPDNLETTYQAAQNGGAKGIRNWLRYYGSQVQDPRRAWIELDYMILIAREDPAEAKRIFADVKARTPENSPVYPRIKKLEKTYN